jgi:hypothetical protein
VKLPQVLALGTLLLFLGARPGAGQTIRGTLLEEGTDQPIPGAFVVLQDSAGVTVSTTLTSSAGTWLLRPPRAGTYRLRADRIGYASFTSEPLTVTAGEAIMHRLVVAVAPVGLSELAVEGAGGQCEVMREESLTVYRVWEEARKALAAIVWTGQQQYYRFDAVQFQRVLDAKGVPTSAVEYEEVRFFGRHPFRSIPTRDLILGGFVQRIAGSMQYYGPDADVMLSRDFLRRHCFRLVNTDETELVGLDFEPMDDARVIDISGTMWLNGESSELRRLDFRYENLDLHVDMERLGGTVEFARLPSGAWIVQRWAIRTPVIELGPPRRSSGGRVLPRRLVLTGIDEGGGQVTAVFLTSRLAGSASTDTLPVRPPADSLIVRFPLRD